jgi:hypothetical protein
MGEGIRKILIVEKNSSLLSFLKERLAAMGYEAHCAEGIPAGILTGIVIRPDMIFYNRTFDHDGETLRGQVSHVSHLSGIPLIPYDFSSENDQDPGEKIRRGLLLDSVLSELRGRKGLSPVPKGGVPVDDARIQQVLELLAKTEKSGRLRIHGDDQKSGEIYLDRGKICGAETADLTGDEAFFALLDLRNVEVEFDESFPTPQQIDPPLLLALLIKKRGSMDAFTRRGLRSDAALDREERNCLDQLISLGFLKKSKANDHG